MELELHFLNGLEAARTHSPTFFEPNILCKRAETPSPAPEVEGLGGRVATPSFNSRCCRCREPCSHLLQSLVQASRAGCTSSLPSGTLPQILSHQGWLVAVPAGCQLAPRLSAPWAQHRNMGLLGLLGLPAVGRGPGDVPLPAWSSRATSQPREGRNQAAGARPPRLLPRTEPPFYIFVIYGARDEILRSLRPR